MTDPLSVTASVIAVAGLAYSSSKAVYELISTVKDAPQTLRDLTENIKGLSQVLDTVAQSHYLRTTELSNSQLACLQHAKPALEGCEAACKAFKTKMERLTTHSQDGRRSFRDGLKLSFQTKNIADFQMRVVNWKSSLALVLDIALL